MVEGVLIDFDGTILDSIPATYKAYSPIFERYNLPIIPFEDFRRRLHKDYRRFLKGIGVPENEITIAEQIWRDTYTILRSNINLFDGAKEFLARVYSEGKKISIVSGGNRSRVYSEVERHDLQPYLHSIVTQGEAGEKFVSIEELIRMGIQQVQIPPHKCVFIDDTVEGLETANSLGVKAIGVTWGLHPEDILMQVNPHVARSFAELYSKMNSE